MIDINSLVICSAIKKLLCLILILVVKDSKREQRKDKEVKERGKTYFNSVQDINSLYLEAESPSIT